MRNKEVANMFLQGRFASTRHLCSTGDKLISYNTCIAQHYDDNIIGNATKYSTTTSCHIGHIKTNITMWTTKKVPTDTVNLIPYL
jgi:hypothetical protein